jgi:hypothetical protein
MRRWINEDNLPEASAGSLGLHDPRQHGTALAGLITPAGRQVASCIKRQRNEQCIANYQIVWIL